MEEKTQKIIGVILAFVVFAIFMIIVSSDGDSTPKVVDLRMDSCYITHKYMDDVLKSPSTAKYQNCYDAVINSIGNNNYRVKTYVNSQNSFGTTIRTNYLMTVHYEGNDLWGLVDYKFYD